MNIAKSRKEWKIRPLSTYLQQPLTIMNEFVKLDVFISGEPLRQVGISQAPGEEPRIARSNTLNDDTCKPKCVRIRKNGLRLSKKKEKVKIGAYDQWD